MARLAPVSRRDLIRRLKQLGFEGPFTGGNHQFMLRNNRRLILPNPHRSDISVDLLRCILRQGGVTIQKWQSSE